MLVEFASLLLLSVVMAHIVPAMLIRRLRSMDLADPDPEPTPNLEPTPGGDDRYNPTPMDVVVTRIMLIRSKPLPPDLVDSIFDLAEYWAHSTNAINYHAEHRDHLRVVGSSEAENQFLIRSYPLGLTGIDGDKNLAEELAYDTNEAKPLPLSKEHEPKFSSRLADYPTPRLARPTRRVVFSIRSKDQGWTSGNSTRGSYDGSFTWFEAGLERFDADQDCDAKCTYDVRHESLSSTAPSLPVCGLRPVHPSIQRDSPDQDYKYVHPLLQQDQFDIHRNKLATREWQDHVVVWSYLDDTEPDSEASEALDAEGRGRATGDGSFVNSLRLGDVITVWGKARFPNWVNNIESVKIDVYWAV
ncbi:hypothetical protein TOPH_06154 [Tolypocladium ophioglossoides CBS 100239]|uniref:Uncharacterized protein n=1 Tax=Tolypocladium ophioglossoides (strain CBS 100239) TaxID=1163406 RepID=A0A0L0N5N4_TOLOC|nr:hypothetical protein TOPH_06154 [Tolypocladium ophioglossoides CBS 100239]